MLKEHILDVAALYLAVGIDPKNPSSSCSHRCRTRGAWMDFELLRNTGELFRMTQFKGKESG